MDNTCPFHDRRGELLIGYLYDDIEPAERDAFARHLPACAECRYELGQLGLVRERLEQWAPPEPAFLAEGRSARASAKGATAPGQVLRDPGRWRTRLGELPIWAQVAAAMLVVGVSAGVANLRISYGADGLRISTGWMPASAAPSPASASAVAGRDAVREPQSSPWRTDLAALEQQLREEMRSAVAQPAARASIDTETMRRVRGLIDDSEKRQQRELSLRVAEIANDLRAQRTSDLRTIGRNLTEIQNTTGADMMRLYRMQNDLAVRVGQVR
jgi:hypothetical protein